MKLKVALLASMALGFFFLAACDISGDSGSDDAEGTEDPAPTTPTDPAPTDPAPTSDEYYVSFKLDGQTYTFTYGLNHSMDRRALSGDACAILEPGLGVYILGTGQACDLEAGEVPAGVEVAYFGIPMDPPATGSYVPAAVFFTISGSEFFSVDVDDDGEPDDFQVTVTAAGAVDGVIEGTFSGTVGLDANEDEMYEVTKTVSEGHFRVYRAPDVHYEDGKLTVILENSPDETPFRVEVWAYDAETDSEYLAAACEDEGTGDTLTLMLKTVDGSGIPTTQDWVGIGGTEYEIDIIIDVNKNHTFGDGGDEYLDEYEGNDDEGTISGDIEATFDYLVDFSVDD